MREILERVLEAPEDAAAWRSALDACAHRGAAGRAAACLEALESVEPGAADEAEARALRRAAGREALERRRGLHAALARPDRCRVSVVVVGLAGDPRTARTLDALAAQTLGRDDTEWIVAPDRNAGLARAGGRYLAHLDAGDAPWPDHLAVLADHLDRTGLPLAFSRARRPDGSWAGAADGAPVLPREAARTEFAPTPCVLHRRRALLRTGCFEPALGYGQGWHLWRRFADRLAASPVPVPTMALAAEDASPERRFDRLLVRQSAAARAGRWHRRGRRALARGEVEMGALCLARAWNQGLDVERYAAGLAAVAGPAPVLAGELVALAAEEIGPFVRGPYARIARGARARRRLTRRAGHRLVARYAEAARRGERRARAEAGAGHRAASGLGGASDRG